MLCRVASANGRPKYYPPPWLFVIYIYITYILVDSWMDGMWCLLLLLFQTKVYDDKTTQICSVGSNRNCFAAVSFYTPSTTSIVAAYSPMKRNESLIYFTYYMYTYITYTLYTYIIFSKEDTIRITTEIKTKIYQTFIQTLFHTHTHTQSETIRIRIVYLVYNNVKTRQI